jgi:hypothetical protein
VRRIGRVGIENGARSGAVVGLCCFSKLGEIGEDPGVLRRTYVEMGASTLMSLEESLLDTLCRNLRVREEDVERLDVCVIQYNQFASRAPSSRLTATIGEVSKSDVDDMEQRLPFRLWKDCFKSYLAKWKDDVRNGETSP